MPAALTDEHEGGAASNVGAKFVRARATRRGKGQQRKNVKNVCHVHRAYLPLTPTLLLLTARLAAEEEGAEAGAGRQSGARFEIQRSHAVALQAMNVCACTVRLSGCLRGQSYCKQFF